MMTTPNKVLKLGSTGTTEDDLGYFETALSLRNGFLGIHGLQ
jgi:hypothetical protein